MIGLGSFNYYIIIHLVVTFVAIAGLFCESVPLQTIPDTQQYSSSLPKWQRDDEDDELI